MRDESDTPDTPEEESQASPEADSPAPPEEVPPVTAEEEPSAPSAETAPAPALDVPAESGDPDAPPPPDAAPREAPPVPSGDPQPEEVIPGAHLEPDLVLAPESSEPRYAEDAEPADDEPVESPAEAPSPDRAPARAALDLAGDARYQGTGKRKTSVARVILKPGAGVYTVNGRALDEFFPRPALQKRAREALESVGYGSRMDVTVRLHGGGVSAQAGALRHGVARALVEADPNLRAELKRRGFLTRDAREKERKKAGLKKARKRPQFSKR
jgi:small subunit ribosomal protein S9